MRQKTLLWYNNPIETKHQFGNIMTSLAIKAPTSITQICAFRASVEILDSILEKLKSLGFKTQEITSGVEENTIDVPVSEDTIGYTYEPNLYNYGVGALDFITRAPQGNHPVKLAEIVSSISPENIRSTEQYIGDYGLTVETSVCKHGEVVYRHNSDEVFDKFKDEN